MKRIELNFIKFDECTNIYILDLSIYYSDT